LVESRQGFTQKGSQVRFHLADVFLPNTAELQAAFDGDKELEGTLVGFSDSGGTPNAFAVVEIVVKQTVIVPVEKLRLAEVDEVDRIQ
jgi:hypothetical protein